MPYTLKLIQMVTHQFLANFETIAELLKTNKRHRYAYHPKTYLNVLDRYRMDLLFSAHEAWPFPCSSAFSGFQIDPLPTIGNA